MSSTQDNQIIILNAREFGNGLKAAAKFITGTRDNVPILEGIVVGLAPKGLTLTATNRYIIGHFLLEDRAVGAAHEVQAVGLLGPVQMKVLLTHLSAAAASNVGLTVDPAGLALELDTEHGKFRIELGELGAYPSLGGLRNLLRKNELVDGDEVCTLGYSAVEFPKVLAAQKLIKATAMRAWFVKGSSGLAIQHMLAVGGGATMLAVVMPPRVDGETSVTLADLGL